MSYPKLTLSALTIVLALTCATALADEKPAPAPLSVTGQAVEALAGYDRAMTQVMTKWKIPGGSLAVAKNGRLVLARGYGLADVEKKEPVQLDSLFRIASISKPITAAAVLRLVEQKKLTLDQRALDILSDFKPPDKPPNGAKFDARWKEITIRHLLQHTGGWDRDKSYDAMFIPIKAAQALGAPAPADSRAVILYMLGQPLDFSPGERYAYSNLGYCILGRVLEKLTGKAYENAVRELVLDPTGIKTMRLGRTLAQFRAPDEVMYYHFDPKETADPVFLYVKEKVQWPYGGFHLEAMDAHGGWLASAPDLVRFASAVDGSRKPPLVDEASRKLIRARPPGKAGEGKDHWYGLGWMTRPVGNDATTWHSGSLPGTVTLLVKSAGGVTWAVLFNTRPRQSSRFTADFEKALHAASAEIKKWPENDMFEAPPRR